MIPPFDPVTGNLPPGIHEALWQEFVAFGGSERRLMLLQQAIRDGIESEIEVLRGQIAEYEALRYGRAVQLELDSLEQIPEALIRGRTAAGLTQKLLTQRLGLKEQQIQRYEATHYRGASLSRLQAVADALRLKIHLRVVTLPIDAVDNHSAEAAPAGSVRATG